MKTISVAAITSLITTAIFAFILHSSCGDACHGEGHHGKECHASSEKGGHHGCDKGHSDCHKGHSCCAHSSCEGQTSCKKSCHGESKCSHSGEGCKKGKSCAAEGKCEKSTCDKTKCTKKEVNVEVEVETDTIH